MNPDSYARALKFAASDSIRPLLKAVRENPEDVTGHGVLADALDEAHPGNKVGELIREQFGLGVHADKGPKGEGNLYENPTHNALDTDHHRYHAPIGRDGPFDLYLGHNELGRGSTGPDGNTHPRWYVRAVSRHPETADTGYGFEFSHDEAHRIPELFPGATPHIRPEPHLLSSMGSIRASANFNRPEYLLYRAREGRQFDARMNHQEESRE